MLCSFFQEECACEGGGEGAAFFHWGETSEKGMIHTGGCEMAK